MKKFKGIIAIILAVCTMVCLLASCGKTIKGTYASQGTVGSNLNGTLTFESDNTVKGDIDVPVIGKVSVDGAYTVEDGKITFTYTVLGISKELTYTFEKDGKSIFIDGTEFVKQ